jgi:hypothetical protein
MSADALPTNGTGPASYITVVANGGPVGPTGVAGATGPTGTTPALLLNFQQTTDISGTLAANTWTSIGTAQTFTPASTTSLLEIVVGGNIQVTRNATDWAMAVIIDGTTRHIIGGTFNTGNALAGAAPYYLGSLSAVAHTVQVQLWSDGASANAWYCRSATQVFESLHIQVVEHY